MKTIPLNTRKKKKTHYLQDELIRMIKHDPTVLGFLQKACLDGVWYWDLMNPEHEWMDPTFWRELGYNPSEMPHSPSAWQDIIHPDDLKTTIDNFHKHLENPEEKFDQVVRYIHKDGSTVYMRCRGMALRDDYGKPMRMLGAHMNITPLMEASNQLQEANDALKLKNKELEHFSYIASHDLQEPLNTITMFVDLIKMEYDKRIDEDCDRYLGYISDSVDRMKLLVTSLLDFSRLGHEAQIVQVDCNKLMDEVISDLDNQIKESNAKITYKKLPVIRAYETELRLLFQNLVGNAIKFQKPDTAPEIEINAILKDGWTFSVKDNGIGIPQKDLHNVFGIFHRLHKLKKYEGTGIGLAHCKKVVNMHNGDIWIQSEIDQGSTFYFNINV
ncbi:MAG: PAS domain-containing sensor histidine kinase [Flavobacteriaceae bacterium]|nr:PAS domain-containing sensor histidine kinase [Flavobacteriaceae bacterium]|tara:strand:+ start:467704 stop:468861 length:1158 start_codon:yes stop_codon:yes gene_type:complete